MVKPVMQHGHIGIRPPGALGVALFHHLSRELSEPEALHFLLRPGGVSGRALEASGGIWIEANGTLTSLPTERVCLPDLSTCWNAGLLPELILACPNPDQLLGVIDEFVVVIEHAHYSRRLHDVAGSVPMVVLCSNGIYFQRLRQLFLERLEESTLMGRLPDLWPDLMPPLIGRLLRGVTIQTGTRAQEQGRTVYRPGPRGRTWLAGGDSNGRELSARILKSRGGWFEVAGASATRLEFDKAMVNLVANLLGQMLAIDDSGEFRPLTVGEIHRGPHSEKIRQLIGHVLEIGKAVHAYALDDTVEHHFARVAETAEEHSDHVPSSLQWLALNLQTGNHRVELTPTEAWLLEPLIRYARSAGLDPSAHYFEQLREELLRKLAAAHRNKKD